MSTRSATTPNYQRLLPEEFDARIEDLRRRYADCDLCAYNCGGDRTAGETGACRVDDTAYDRSLSRMEGQRLEHDPRSRRH